jgi:hypothetical protein
LNVGPGLVILVKENIVELAHIDHFTALLAFVEVLFLGFAQLVEVIGIHLVGRGAAGSSDGLDSINSYYSLFYVNLSRTQMKCCVISWLSMCN